jgi:hypothetical protein
MIVMIAMTAMIARRVMREMVCNFTSKPEQTANHVIFRRIFSNPYPHKVVVLCLDE